jgi:hypothetical protein
MIFGLKRSLFTGYMTVHKLSTDNLVHASDIYQVMDVALGGALTEAYRTSADLLRQPLPSVGRIVNTFHFNLVTSIRQYAQLPKSTLTKVY